MRIPGVHKMWRSTFSHRIEGRFGTLSLRTGEATSAQRHTCFNTAILLLGVYSASLITELYKDIYIYIYIYTHKLSCYYLKVKVSVTQLCLTLCDLMDCSLPGFSVHGDSPGENTGVGCLSLLQRIFLTQRVNLGLLYCRPILYHLSQRITRESGYYLYYPKIGNHIKIHQ